jgi:hypothetical protein
VFHAPEEAEPETWPTLKEIVLMPFSEAFARS